MDKIHWSQVAMRINPTPLLPKGEKFINSCRGDGIFQPHSKSLSLYIGGIGDQPLGTKGTSAPLTS